MLEKKKILALIPARGGSKGITDKNIIEINGKPLIAYSIEAARESKYIDEVVVTTDSDQIANVAKDYGAEIPFMRPQELASDHATTLDAVLHAVKKLENKKFDVLVLLQPTSPLRTAEDIDKALEKFFDADCESLVSVSQADDSPILMRVIDNDGMMRKLLEQDSTIRRQDMPQVYKVNGSIYINLISEINQGTSFNDNKIPFIMKKSHSVDIDEYSDIFMMNYYMKNSDICKSGGTLR